MKLYLKVVPGSKKILFEKYGVDMFGNEIYKLKLTAKPIAGKANEQLISFLSEKYGVTKNKIKIISGESSSNKIIDIEK